MIIEETILPIYKMLNKQSDYSKQINFEVVHQNENQFLFDKNIDSLKLLLKYNQESFIM